MQRTRLFLIIAGLFVVVSLIVQPALSQGTETDFPDTLEHYNGRWQDAISELEDLDVIAGGGTLIFQEDRAFFSGRGSFFTPLASQQPHSDIVMAGELTFTASGSDEFESCSLLSRIIMDTSTNTAIRYLEIGLSNEEDGFYYDLYGDRNSDRNFGIFSLVVDRDQPHHFLFLAIDNQLTLYFDGQLVLKGRTINDRSGTYGIALVGKGASSRCEGNNIWVYEVPVIAAGICEITSSGTVNRRAGPGTGYDWAGTLTPGNILHAVAQTIGADGYTWYQLEDESWVREDIVNARGTCSTLPQPGEARLDETADTAEESTEKGDTETVGEKSAEATEEPVPDDETEVEEIVGDDTESNSEDQEKESDGESLSLSQRVEQLSSGEINCMIRTERDQFASVRVGPGTNRTAILFLPATRDFNVLGQAASTVDNGALWWKLDKDQVSSRTSAAELWVAQDQVDATGDCDLVPFVEPPPIIEIITTTDVLPQSGAWTYDPGTVIVTCPAGTVSFEAEDPSFPVLVEVESGGGAIRIDGDRLARSEPGVYVGHFVEVIEGETIAVTFTARVVTATLIATEASGQISGCDIVVRSTMTR